MQIPEIPLSVTILAEARDLLSALRRNRRFGYLLSFAATAQPSEHPLVKELKSLRDVLRLPLTPNAANRTSSLTANGLLVPPDVLLTALDPFFEVIRSRDASGLITGVALLALDRIAHRLIHLATHHNLLPHYATALAALVDATAASRFDATDPAADEVVLARITRVLSTVLSSTTLSLLSDASILRAVEACLAIAAGRRRASDLLKRTADSALIDIYKAMAHNLSAILASTSAQSPTSVDPTPPPLFVVDATGPAFGRAIDAEAFRQHGPASDAVVISLLKLCARMTDPYYAQSAPERALGIQLLSAFLSSAGSELKSHIPLKRVLLRDCARGILRSLGLFKSPPHVISAAFSISLQMVHVLAEDAAPFLLALLERVYPYYISGYENRLPKSPSEADIIESTSTNGATNGVPSPGPNASVEAETDAIEIDPVIREIGLDSLAELLSIPGLLCVVYRLSDCDLKRNDIVGPLLQVLGQSAKSKGLRRRSKRLRASSSGSNRLATVSEVDSEEDEESMQGSKVAPEASRFGRAASILCADSILAVIDSISDRLKLETAGLTKQPFMDEKAMDISRNIRKEKLQLHKAAEAFNTTGKAWKASKLLLMLREHGLVESLKEEEGTVSEDLDDDVRAIVRFIRETPGLSKAKIGEVLGEPDNLSRRVLADYTATFELENRPFTESLRVYLESFRLPGEAQKIDRIVQSFANRYHAQNSSSNSAGGREGEVEEPKSPTHEGNDLGENVVPSDGPQKKQLNPVEDNLDDSSHALGKSVLKTADAVYVLSFSVVMLNTDQHNDSIRKKMTLDDFVRNCRGINDGQDCPRWFLAEIFDSIAAVEIRMSDEAGIAALTDLLWDEYIKEIGAFEKVFPSPSESRIFDEHIFLLAWESGVLAANAILHEAGEANSVQRALEGFLSVARCATTYKISRPTDAVISALCAATTLRDGPLHGAVVRFGTDIKAQMASVALSGVSRQCGDWLRADGWQALVGYLLRLHALCLLPCDLEQRIGGYGSELLDISKEDIPSSDLIPQWWPSQTDRNGVESETVKPRKAPRPNGFFAAILAASIGSEVETDEEDDDEHHSQRKRHVSHSMPYYLRTRSREDTEARDLARKCIAGCRIEDVVINEAKVLQSTSLDYLCKAVSKAAIRLMETGFKPRSAEVEDASTEESALESDSSLLWSEITPSSPRFESSIIAGVMSNRNGGQPPESEQEYPSFGLAPSWEGAIRDRDERKARDFVVAFCIDVLCELTLQNRDRLHIPWPELHALLVRIIAPATQSYAIVERAVVALLRVGVRMLHREALRDDILRGFNLLVRLPADKAEHLSVPIASGIFNIVKGHGATIQSTSGWHAILSILENLSRYQSAARDIGLETISLILKEVRSPAIVSAETYAPLLDAILSYTSCPSVDISIRALEMLYLLSQRVSIFTKEDSFRKNDKDITGEARAENEVWSEFWGPLFLGFASSVRDSRGKVRNSALAVMERVTASGGSAEFLTARQWKQALSTVILPLMTQLFSSGGFLSVTVEAEREAQKRIFEERNANSTANRGRVRMFAASAEHDEQLLRSVMAACSRTRMRAAVLTSKTFLQHHIGIAAGLNADEFTELWVHVLDVMRLAIESGAKMDEEGKALGSNMERRSSETDELREHVPETVKNMLLVMCDCGLLKQQDHVRWNSTFDVVRKFIPDIEEVVVAATEEPVTPQRKRAAEVVSYGSVVDDVEHEASAGMTEPQTTVSGSVEAQATKPIEVASPET